MKSVLKILILILGVSPAAHSTELFESHTSARALGMGGAYAALVEDEDSLWFNPAGIAKNGGVFWTVLDPHFGTSELNPQTVLQNYSDLTDQTKFNTALQNMYGKPIWAGGGAKTSIIMPFFAMAYYYDLDASIIAENPVNPTLTTNYVLDKGIAIGTGWSMAGILQMGMSVKSITRTGVRKDWGAQTIADIVAGGSTNTIFDTFTNTKGHGFAFDYGMNLTIPSPIAPTISFVWKNVGNTTFRPSTTGGAAPPTDESDMQVGASFLVDLPLVSIAPVIEFRHLDAAKMDIGERIHMGIEVGLPLIDIRAGLYQGYYSYGLGFNLGLVKIDAATWGTEMGGYAGQYESRRYMVQATVRFGFDFGFGSGGSSSAKSGSSASGGKGGGIFGGGSGSGGSSGSSGSSYARRKAKQRR
jgi:hypothetical protein